MTGLTLTVDTNQAHETISALADATELFPQLGDAVLRLLDAGEEIFLFQLHDTVAALAGEVVVRLYPSDCLFGLVSAFRAREPKCLLFEHFIPPVELQHSNTTRDHVQ